MKHLYSLMAEGEDGSTWCGKEVILDFECKSDLQYAVSEVEEAKKRWPLAIFWFEKRITG